jgi:hypothetical protein
MKSPVFVVDYRQSSADDDVTNSTTTIYCLRKWICIPSQMWSRISSCGTEQSLFVEDPCLD